MSQSLDGQSVLTSKGALLLYYIMGIIAIGTGVPLAITFVGALISGMIARKEGAVIVARHCKWLSRSVWVSALLIFLICTAAMIFFGMNHTEVLDLDTSNMTFEQMLEIPIIRELIGYIVGICVVIGLILLWFLYRMIRGLLMLLADRPPKSIS